MSCMGLDGGDGLRWDGAGADGGSGESAASCGWGWAVCSEWVMRRG